MTQQNPEPRTLVMTLGIELLPGDNANMVAELVTRWTGVAASQ